MSYAQSHAPIVVEWDAPETDTQLQHYTLDIYRLSLAETGAKALTERHVSRLRRYETALTSAFKIPWSAIGAAGVYYFVLSVGQEAYDPATRQPGFGALPKAEASAVSGILTIGPPQSMPCDAVAAGYVPAE